MSEPAILPDHSAVVRKLVDTLMADKKPALTAASVKAPTPGVSPLPACQAYVFDGSASDTEGDFIVDIAFFAKTYAEASSLSRTCDQRFMGYPHRVSSDGRTVLLDRVTTNVIPNEVPFTDDDSVRRFQATYSVSFRRR
jgi:hypothetical protein